jgi:hypothetical protein
MGIRTDDESAKDLDKSKKKKPKKAMALTEKAMFFTQKGAMVPDFLTPLVWDLTLLENGEFEFDVSILITDEDLSTVAYEEGTRYKAWSAQKCAKLAHEPLVFDIQSDHKATIYIFPVPEGDMLALTIIGRKDGKDSELLEKLKVFRGKTFVLDGWNGPEYFRKEVRIATGKNHSEVE